jgi:signal transduction histidine kinase
LSAALAAVAARVEQDYPVTVEVVCVGDAELTEAGRAVVAAASEAVLNAAKHAGGTISVYAEVDEGIRVYVRDRGAGFDLAAVPADRRGISESMRGRMQRAGGTCDIRTGERGTEVVLEVP